MTEHHVRLSKPSRLVMVGIWAAGIASVGAIVAMVLYAIEKVQNGQGLDTFRTHWLVEFNWVGFLVFLVAVAIALAVGLFFRYREWHEIRKFEAKYSGERHG
jgi:hypothetical protein